MGIDVNTKILHMNFKNLKKSIQVSKTTPVHYGFGPNSSYLVRFERKFVKSRLPGFAISTHPKPRHPEDDTIEQKPSINVDYAK